MSGYTHCACRDCMDVAITGDQGGWTLCAECLDAECMPYPPGTGEWPGRRPAGEYECQRDDAYGATEWPCTSCTTECYCTANHDSDADCAYCDANAEVHCP